MSASYTDRCPCWHTLYSREAGVYRQVTDPDCDHCGGTGFAEFLIPHKRPAAPSLEGATA